MQAFPSGVILILSQKYDMKSALPVNTFFYDTAADDNITVI
jgi:hypothetical protein